MKWVAFSRHRAGTTFVLAFFLVFVVLGGALGVEALRVYHGIDRRADDTHVRTTPLTCLSGAARRADIAGGMNVVELEDGTDALRTVESGKVWLYFSREGYLYRLAAGADEDSAERLCRAGGLQLKWVGQVIRADHTAPDGSRSALLLCPRSGGGGT